MKTKLLIAICAASISACSSQSNREQVSGDYEYMKAKERDLVLQVPEGLESPTRSQQYELPILRSTNNKQFIGDKIRITSPRLVLPLVSGSHVEEGSDSATVSFDQVDDSVALDKTIWDKVLSYLAQNNIGVESFDRQSNILVTDWVISIAKADSSWYEFSNESTEQARKFQLSLDVAPHGRTATLKSKIIDYINENGNSALDSMDPITMRNSEVNFVNYIIAEYDVDVRLAQTQRIEKIRNGFSSELGFNSDGDSAFLVDADYSDAWPRLLLVLRKMGFDVVDLDQSSGIMFVVYKGSKKGFWSGMFADDILLLKEDDYRIFVRGAGDKTSVTFKDKESVAFDAIKVTDIFPTFKEYMAADNLDI